MGSFTDDASVRNLELRRQKPLRQLVDSNPRLGLREEKRRGKDRWHALFVFGDAQRDALALGAEVYAEKPRVFARRLRALWKSWRSGARPAEAAAT